MRSLKYWLFIALILEGCQVQQLENYNPDFNGTWRSDVYYSPGVGDSIRNYLTVDGKNSGLGIACKKDCSFCDCLVTQSGRAKINTSTNSLQVGGTVNQILIIEQEPFINDDGIWEMKLENVSYKKYD
jgi:hypothetical protein